MSYFDHVENQELVQKLIDCGFGDMLEILYHENYGNFKVYTKKGKLNKSGACRALGCKPKELEEIFESAKFALGKDWQHEK